MKKNNYLGIGLALIFLAVAVVVLIDLLGFLSSNNFLGQYWPLLFVLVGLFAFGRVFKRKWLCIWNNYSGLVDASV